MTEDWTYPDRATLGALAAGGTPIVSTAELGAYLGGIDTSESADQLVALIDAATDFVERTLGYSFRKRTVTVNVEVTDTDVPIWLPYGMPTDVTAQCDGAAYTDFTLKSLFNLVTGVVVKDAGEYSITYSVGSLDGSTRESLVKNAVMRVAASLYHQRFAEGVLDLRRDVRTTLAHYKAKADWNG